MKLVGLWFGSGGVKRLIIHEDLEVAESKDSTSTVVCSISTLVCVLLEQAAVARRWLVCSRSTLLSLDVDMCSLSTLLLQQLSKMQVKLHSVPIGRRGPDTLSLLKACRPKLFNRKSPVVRQVAADSPN